MNELIAAAKAVIDLWNRPLGSGLGDCFIKLRDAVEQAEKQEAVGFDDYWHSEKFRWDRNLKRDVQAVWTAAQQAERERIKNVIAELLDTKDPWIHYSTLLERIDEPDGI